MSGKHAFDAVAGRGSAVLGPDGFADARGGVLKRGIGQRAKLGGQAVN